MISSPSLIYQGHIIEGNSDETLAPTPIHLDIGAEVNVIDQRFAPEHNLSKIDAPLPSPKWMDGNSTYCFAAYLVQYELQDSWGRMKRCRHVFYSITKEDGPPLVLGMPALSDEGIKLDLAARRWRFGVDAHSHEILGPQEFANSLEGEGAIYALLVAKVGSSKGQETNVGVMKADASQSPNVDAAPQLPKELQEYKDVFSTEEAGQLPSHEGRNHAIETTAEPPFGPLYNLSNTELAALREYLDDALAKGWIRHSTSPAGAPILFVPKKDGGLRLCVDYRGLNRVTVKNRHPLPLISETLDRLTGSKRFTKLDLKDAYHRIRIRKGDEWKTAFRTRYGHFEYLVMPFGLTNAPATFQAYINKSLAGIIDSFCVVYLDDILIYSENEADHIDHVKQVLDRLRRFSLFANLKKCEFFTTEVEFLGFIVTIHGVAMDKRRVTAIQEWPKPKSYHDVQVFLGFVNFYRRFIHHYSQIAGPLTDLLKGSTKGIKTGPFEWSVAAEHAFTQLRDSFTDAPLLRHFDPDLPIRVETDASEFALAGILTQLQEDNKQWHPVAFHSRKMIPAERNYETHDQELLAIVTAFKHWRHYLEGSFHPVEVLTDHNNLKYFMGMPNLNGRQARWAMKLSTFDFFISHRSGKATPADAPSRRPDYKGENEAISRLLPTLQQKLASIGSLVSPIFAAIRTAYGQGTTYEHAKRSSSVENPSAEHGLVTSTQYSLEAGSKEEVTAKKASLGSLMTAAVQETHLSAVHPSRLREPQPAPRPVGSLGETPTQHNRNVAEEQLNPVAGTVGCKQLVPRLVAQIAAISETAYESSSKSIFELVKALQLEDPFVQQRKVGEAKEKRKRDAGAWTMDSQGLLRYNDLLYVPEEASVREELLKRHHDDPLAGHFGIDKTLELMSRKYYWDSIKTDVKEYVDSCDVCQRVKVKRHRPHGELNALPQPSGPWKEITMDFITDLPPSKRKGHVYDAILVVVDRYTKMVRYLPTNKTIKAPDLEEMLMEEVFLKFGPPNGIVTDRGSVFTSAFWSEVCYQMKVKRRLSTAFHPQTDGQTERQNQTLEHYLRTYCSENQDDWATLLPVAEYVYQNAENKTLGCNPFYAMMGYNPEFELSTEDGTPRGEVPAAKERIKEIFALREKLEERWRSVVEWSARSYNKKHQAQSFNEGDLVMLSAKNLKQRKPSKKLSNKAIGPFIIRKRIGTQAYQLALPPTYRIHNVFHVSLLELYHRRDNSNMPAYTAAELIDDVEEWDVEKILDKRKRRGEFEYLIRWDGYPPEYDQWVPEEDMEHAQELLDAFEKPKKRRRKAR